MKILKFSAVAFALTFSAVTIQHASAQGTGLSRTDLVKQDINVPGHEAIQVRVDFDAGAASIKHKHPGEEIAYVLVGTLEYRLEGREPIRLKAGESLFIPAGVPHIATNVGGGRASELATYIVEKGPALVTPAD